MAELTDRVPWGDLEAGLRDLQHQGEHQRRGARGTRRSLAGYSGQRRLTRTLPRMPGVSAGWCHAVLDSVSASSWGGDPPPGSSELTTHARPIRGEATRRGDRHPPRTPRSSRPGRRGGRHVRHRAPGDRPPPAGGLDGLAEHRLQPPRAPPIARHRTLCYRRQLGPNLT